MTSMGSPSFTPSISASSALAPVAQIWFSPCETSIPWSCSKMVKTLPDCSNSVYTLNTIACSAPFQKINLFSLLYRRGLMSFRSKVGVGADRVPNFFDGTSKRSPRRSFLPSTLAGQGLCRLCP